MSLSLDIKKTFGGFSIDLSLSLGEELLVLFGPSGAGKSLVLKMISGIVRPDTGSVSVGGEALFDSSSGIDVPMRRRRVGHLFQDYALFPHMTVNGNIVYGAASHGALASPRTDELVRLMRLTGLEDRFPRELSGGQRQRTALARTLASSPRVLLLDEPFSALDYQVREKLRADLLNIHRIFPVTTVLVTHDLEEAFMLGTRIAVINNGRVEQVGGREEVFYRPATRSVARFMGVRNIFAGRVRSVDTGFVVVDNPDIGLVRAPMHAGASFTPGQEVSFCIRPEEILVIRPDRAVDPRVHDNIVEGVIGTVTGRGSTHILFLRAGATELKVELPNFVMRKLGLATGGRIRVSLKKENVWVIPGQREGL